MIAKLQYLVYNKRALPARVTPKCVNSNCRQFLLNIPTAPWRPHRNRTHGCVDLSTKAYISFPPVINDLWSCQKQGCIGMKSLLWDNHGYCRSIMIGGIQDMMSPSTSSLRDTPPPPCGWTHAEGMTGILPCSCYAGLYTSSCPTHCLLLARSAAAVPTSHASRPAVSTRQWQKVQNTQKYFFFANNFQNRLNTFVIFHRVKGTTNADINTMLIVRYT